MDGTYTDNDDVTAHNWLTTTGYSGYQNPFSLVSTCTGCGMREATKILKGTGRPGAVWVMVFLSDGAVNMSDTYHTLNDPDIIPSSFPNGFCTQKYWSAYCTDKNLTPDTASITTKLIPRRVKIHAHLMQPGRCATLSLQLFAIRLCYGYGR